MAPLSRRAARQRLSPPADAVVDAGTIIDSVVEAQALIAAAAVAEDIKKAAPVDDIPAEDEVAPAAPSAVVEDAAAEEDAFEKAARALGHSAVTEDEASDPEEPEQEQEAEEPAAHVAPRRPRALRRVVTVGATLGVMSLAGLLAVSMTVPTGAVAAAQGVQDGATTSLVTASSMAAVKGDDKGEQEIQAYVASSDLPTESMERSDNFSTVSLIDIAAEQGINYSGEVYTNDPNAAIQWPFVVGVGMTYGYGMRNGRLHEGIDFVPGNGAPIQAIADGVVRKATEQGGAYGVTVYIDHVVDGKVITSHYSHMQHGSLRVQTGDTVKVGDIVGLTGNTGRSYGAHLHFELIINGSTIDPMPWMQENAGRDSLG